MFSTSYSIFIKNKIQPKLACRDKNWQTYTDRKTDRPTQTERQTHIHTLTQKLNKESILCWPSTHLSIRPALECGSYIHCFAIDENWFPFSQQLSSTNNFFVRGWLCVLTSSLPCWHFCLTWIGTGLLHADTHSVSSIRPIITGKYSFLEVIQHLCLLQSFCFFF